MNNDIGSRFVACKGWRHVDGVRYRDDSVPDDIDHWRPASIHEWRNRSPTRQWSVDTDDPATLGCIEHGLLPEAWPGCEIVVEQEPGGLSTVSIYDGLGLRFIDRGPLAEALLAALEASPANQGGGR